MALPANFYDAIDYFEDAVGFLVQYSWTYQHSNVAVLVEGVLESFPKAFTDYFITVANSELNRFPFVSSEYLMLDSDKLMKFRAKIKRLLPNGFEQRFPANAETIQVNMRGQYRMNNKKYHEVTHLSERIDEICHDTDVLVDCGAGLGYLSEALYARNQDHLIVGLECEKERVITARKRRTQYWKAAKDAVVYKQHLVKLDSDKFIEKEIVEIVSNNLPVPPPIEGTKVGIIGLHACADLSITSIQLFLDMPIMRHLVTMPCCYHKMEVSDEDNKELLNFPLSDALKNVAARSPVFKKCFNRPFLRLACQQTAARWAQTGVEEHAFNGEQMYYRAVAEAIIDRDSEMVFKIKSWRRTQDAITTLPTDFKSFTEHFGLCNKQNEVITWTPKHQERFYNLNDRYGIIKGPRLMEGLVCLQTTLQRLCENIVLYDRLCYMQEYAEENKILLTAHYEKILNEKLSPRCFVLIAHKEIVPKNLNLVSNPERNSPELIIKSENVEP